MEAKKPATLAIPDGAEKTPGSSIKANLRRTDGLQPRKTTMRFPGNETPAMSRRTTAATPESSRLRPSKSEVSLAEPPSRPTQPQRLLG